MSCFLLRGSSILPKRNYVQAPKCKRYLLRGWKYGDGTCFRLFGARLSCGNRCFKTSHSTLLAFVIRNVQGLDVCCVSGFACLLATWVVVKNMVPFWVLNIIRHLVFRRPPTGTVILITAHILTDWLLRVSQLSPSHPVPGWLL